MAKFLFGSALFFCLHSYALINSEIASKEQIPAAMQIWSMQENQLQFRCSGTLIAPDVVITEASCIYEQNHHRRNGTFLISHSTKTDFSKPLSDILQRVLATVRKDIKHPSENLVLLYLNQAIPIKPAVLLQPDESHQLINPGISFVAGWGFSQTPARYPWFKKMVNYVFDSNEIRQSNTKHLGTAHIGSLTNHLLEFGQEPNDALGCTGDEGGPILINIQTSFVNTERLVGIISSHTNLAQCHSPTYGLRLDTLFNFIHEQLILGCQKGYRAWCDVQGLLPPGFDEDDLPEVIPSKANPPPSPLPAEPKKEENDPHFFKTRPSDLPVKDKEQKEFKKMDSAKNLKIKMESIGCNCMKVRKR